MRTRSNVIPALLVIVVSAFVAGCGDSNSNDNAFIGDGSPTATPLNGRTSTPVRTTTPEPGATPTVTDTSEISISTPTPSDTAGGPTPTPVAGGCIDGDQVTVIASLNQSYGAALINLGYPGSVNIPGTGTAQSVVDRVHFAASGLTTVSDGDKSGDGTDDTLTASFVGLSANPAGTFVTVTFDCVAGQAPPASGSFMCTVVSAATPDGVDIPDEQCSLNVTGP